MEMAAPAHRAASQSIPAGSPGALSIALVLMAALLSLAGCENRGDTSLTPRLPSGGSSLSADVIPIFAANCSLAGCHNSADRASGQVLEAGWIFDPTFGIVNVPSVEATINGLDRAEPGDTALSYIVHKIEGTQASVGDPCCFGLRMPRTGPPYLSAAEIQTIKSWIVQGCADN